MYYQYRVESKPSGFGGYILQLLFQLFTKGVCLAINIFFYTLTSDEMKRVMSSHNFTSEDQDAYKILQSQSDTGDTIFIVLIGHSVMMLISFVVNYLTCD